MAQDFQWLLIAAGVIASLVLALFITRQVRLLQRARQEQEEREARWQKQHAHLVESIRVLARSMLESQIELSEGCIRVKVLLDTLAPELSQDSRFWVFQRMYQALEHMPTHAARQQTDRRFVRKMDVQRFKLERENQEAILAACQHLLTLRFDPMGGVVEARR